MPMINLRKISLAATLCLFLGGTNNALAFDLPFLSQTSDEASTTPKTAPENESSSSWASTAQEIILRALSQTGVKYKYGGINPDSGFDCSGLIVYVYNKAAGIKLPRTIQLMSTKGRSVDGQPPAPGDLVFFNTTGEKYSHAGIYVGQGRFVHAPSAGGTVRLDYITSPYWAAKFTEARRMVPQ